MSDEPELPLLSHLIPLEWLPDETLFSLCSRHHRLSGNRLPATTCRTLFGHSRQGCAHDFPSRIDWFVHITRGCLGSAQQIVHARTLLPYFLPFAPPSVGQEAINAMRGPSIGGLKFRLGLLTSGTRANHPLKACLDCIEDDRRSYASAYWHRSHQLPGVAVCLKHKTWLCTSNMKATGVGRFQWLLPHPSHLLTACPVVAPEAAFSLATAAVSLAAHTPGSTFAPERTRRCYRQALQEKGMLSGGAQGRLRHKEAGAEFAEFRRILADVEDLGAPPAGPQEAAAIVARMVYSPRSGVHPLKHLALISWLFPSFEEFESRYQLEDQTEIEQPPTGASPGERRRDVQRRKFLVLVDEGLSTTAASRSVGVDPATGMAWAATRGISTGRRPKVLTPDVHARMVAALMRGADKEAAAAIGNVSVSTVTKVLRTEVGLREAWRAAQFDNSQRRHRRRWIKAMAANPLSGVKVARLLESASYAWLYRNDRAWLTDCTTSMVRITPQVGPRVDWDQRDSGLAAAVRQAALALRNQGEHRQARLCQLCQHIPELRPKLRHLDRLPLTRLAIFDALTPRARPAKNALPET